ncbi:MAG: LysR family transcriptional regulator [Phycisphaerales bacterium]|nr:LysR family transcriptional regulator [Phycisphaerales bacterium]
MPRRKPIRQLIVRGKLWVQIDGKPALTDAGADLLEQIEACGSLSEAARRLRFAYRRAWLLVDAMNTAWPQPLVTTAIGGRKGGGTQITEQGRLILRSYRDLQLQLEHLLDMAGNSLAFTF